MSKSEMKNFLLLKNLIRSLRQFGLNPYDWKLERSSLGSDSIQVYHRQDTDFRLRGRIARSAQGELHVRGLRLISL